MFFKAICWALIFLIRIRFLPGVSLILVQHWDGALKLLNFTRDETHWFELCTETFREFKISSSHKGEIGRF